jgi:hypothetical protein
MAHHGNTPAAWTGVTLILVGFLVAGVGLVLYSWTIFWVGVAIGVLGVIVGKVMAAMGMGSEPRGNKQERVEHFVQDQQHGTH